MVKCQFHLQLNYQLWMFISDWMMLVAEGAVYMLLFDTKQFGALSDVLAFARAMQDALAKKTDSDADVAEESKPADES